MTRLTLHTTQTAPEGSRAFVEKAAAANGFLPNLIGILANAPEALETYLTVGQIVEVRNNCKFERING